MSRLSAVVRAYPVTLFLLVAFAWSWTVWMVGDFLGHGGSEWLMLPYAWGPLIAAITVTTLAGHDLRQWAAQLRPQPGVGVRWYGLALIVPFLLIQTPELLAWALGYELTLVDPAGLLREFLIVLLLAGALEEPGWRGFMQPRLQERWSGLVGALVVGVGWALWHVPIVAGGGFGYQGDEWVLFFIVLPLFSVVMAWIYNSTRGGLVFVMLFHAMINVTPVIETDGAVAGGVSQLVVLIGIPLVIVLYHGPRYLATTRPEPPIPGT